MNFNILLALAAIAALGAANAQPSPNCVTSCGNVTIPYPFGSGEGCYYSKDFLVTCNRSSEEPIPFYRKSNIVISNISTSKSELEILAFVAQDCYNISGRARRTRSTLRSRDFRISTKNKFIAIGCDTYAFFRGRRGNESDATGCVSSCGKNSLIKNDSCSGVGCCEVAVPEGMSSFNMSLRSFSNHSDILDFNPCSYGFFVEEDKFNFSTTYLSDFKNLKMPMLLDWAIGNLTCDEAKNTQDFLCKGNSECDRDYKGVGYRCRCKQGYEGNSYLPNGCSNIDECLSGNSKCGPNEQCHDNDGSYTCKCKKGYYRDGTQDGEPCTAKQSEQSTVIKIVVGISTSALFLIVFVTWLYFILKKRKIMMLREKFFKQNGGIMLQQRISSRDGSSHDQAKVFTIEELMRATNNYDESKVIGKGGYGTVYKGVLSDNRTVAIKKSKIPDQNENQIEQFINEVVILSQINHRNVVKLIGCCLETEIPSLVYEFIPNGTLSDHIHNNGKSAPITWDIRLRIATETAEALSYLHSSASVPIIHRDVKPTNILLDDNYVAKVADFGASKLIPVDHLELATMVQGTLGYLDPEYLQTNQLTNKSDVYSFGVVLVELLTGKKALSFDRPEEERNLAIYFLYSLKEGRLLHVLDEHLQLNDVPSEVIQVSRLAERCLRVKADERPTMKEVAIELGGILTSMTQNHPWVQTSPNEDEGEYLLKQLASDYECTNGVNVSIVNSSTFDSMSKQAMFPIASGR